MLNFYELIKDRRSVRLFSSEQISDEILENIVKAASTAPSGANKQPWKFCIVKNHELKSRIRGEAEKIERLNYEVNFSKEFKNDLKFLGTDFSKPFLEQAPALIIAIKEKYSYCEDGVARKNYYVNESIGIAIGFIIAAIHLYDLSTVVYTPSPMGFLNKLLNLPENESATAILPVGYALETYSPPEKSTKHIQDILKWI